MTTLSESASERIGVGWAVRLLDDQNSQVERLGLSAARLWQVHQAISLYAPVYTAEQNLLIEPRLIVAGGTYGLNLLGQLMQLNTGLIYYGEIRAAWQDTLQSDNLWQSRALFVHQSESHDKERARRFNQGLKRAVDYIQHHTFGRDIRSTNVASYGIQAVADFMNRTVGLELLFFQHPEEVREGIEYAFQVLHFIMLGRDAKRIDKRLLDLWRTHLMREWLVPEPPYELLLKKSSA